MNAVEGLSTSPAGRCGRGLLFAQRDRATRVAAVILFCLAAAGAVARSAAAKVIVCRQTTVVLRWIPSSCPDVCGYRVFRATARGGPYTLLTADLLTLPYYVDHSVQNGSMYVYVVTARDFAGNESLPSRAYESEPVRIDLEPAEPSWADSDLDGLTDSEELSLGTGLLSADTDGDGLTDGDEVLIYGTDPIAADSDGDRVDDGIEVDEGTDPMDERDKYDRCDVNRDRAVDAVDVQLAIVYMIESRSDPTCKCDIDSDGFVTAVDLQRIITAAIGISSSAL